MKTVIFGAAGFIGRNVVERLREKGEDLIATDFVDSPFGGDIDYRKIDMLDKEAVQNVVQEGNMVIHLAASPLVASLKKPVENMRVNIEGSLNIMDAARESSVDKVIFSSASSVVGDVQYNPVDEKHPCVPKTPYAVAKYTVENYLRVYKEIYELNHIIFRFFNIYGPYQYPESGGLIPMIHKRVASGLEFTIFGDGSATRDFVYVEDLADVLIAGCKADVDEGIVNLGTGKGATILETVELAGKVLGVEPNLKYEPERPGEIANFVADTRKLESVVGFAPSTSLEEGLTRTFDWLKKNAE
ncbi:MAG: NAD-dependent epimerase/dehydratase family protein [Methanobacteriota archaeon]|nr:MAG: NAD-dependent epimerase/dehydratase family protein [Euryarchaeota archaeon]